MALFGYVCPACWSTEERFVPVENRDAAAPLCSFCHELNFAVRMQRSLTVPAIRGQTVSRP